jgi:hypothetical protein
LSCAPCRSALTSYGPTRGSGRSSCTSTRSLSLPSARRRYSTAPPYDVGASVSAAGMSSSVSTLRSSGKRHA